MKSGKLFSYVDLEARVRPDHPVRAIRTIVNEACEGAISLIRTGIRCCLVLAETGANWGGPGADHKKILAIIPAVFASFRFLFLGAYRLAARSCNRLAIDGVMPPVGDVDGWRLNHTNPQFAVSVNR